MVVVVQFVVLISTILIGSILYYYCGIFKKVGSTSIEEMNESELFVSNEGILEEEFPKEIINENEANIINKVGRILFFILSNVLWILMGITAGRIAYLLSPPEFYKLIVYLLVYFFFLRIPFGILNKTIERSYEIKVMPDKLVIAIMMILSYVIGINGFDEIPKLLIWHLQIIE